MSKPSQIFQTDNPSRWRRVQWSSRVLLALLVFLILVLFVALARFKNPSLPLLEQQADSYQKILKPKGVITFKNSRNKEYQGFRDILTSGRRILPDGTGRPPKKTPLSGPPFIVPGPPRPVYRSGTMPADSTASSRNGSISRMDGTLRAFQQPSWTALD